MFRRDLILTIFLKIFTEHFCNFSKNFQKGLTYIQKCSLNLFPDFFLCFNKVFFKRRLHKHPSRQQISSYRPSHSFEYTSYTFAQILRLVTGQSQKLVMFNFCDQITSSFKLQQGSRSFDYAVVESLSIGVICYHNNYSIDCVRPYFPIERIDASYQLPATYLATDSLRLKRSCKRAFRIFFNYRKNFLQFLHKLF